MAESAVAHAVKPLYSAEDISRRVDELASAISAARLRDPIVVAVLKGSFIFAADLIRALHRHGLSPEIDFIFLASYGAGTQSEGKVRVLRDIGSDIAGRDVVIVDAILDSGRTLAFAKSLLLKRGAARALICVLVNKQVKRAAEIVPDFAGFSCPPIFVVGYGMDLADRYRELPFIGEIAGDARDRGRLLHVRRRPLS
jgi:hypoxanthine phosphoribosyltransferase